MADHVLDFDGENPHAIGAGNLVLPAAGLWTFEGLLSTTPSPLSLAPGHRVGVTLAGIRRVGTIVRCGDDYMQARVRVVGGAGGFDRVQETRDYRGYTADRIAEDILKDAGETLGAGWTMFSTYCPHWLRVTTTARENLRRVMRLTDRYRWRAARDGTIALHHDLYDTEPPDDFYDRDEVIHPQEGFATIAPATTALEPGQLAYVFGELRRVDRIVYRVGNESMRLRADLWFA